LQELLKIKDKSIHLSKKWRYLAGAEYLEAIKKEFDIEINYIADGSTFVKKDKLVEISGDSKYILSMERTILNMIIHASSIATLTNRFVQLI